jgi:hypothetical protein
MIWFNCKGCGFYMQFETNLLNLKSLNYRCPICLTLVNPDIQMRTPVIVVSFSVEDNQ